MNCVTASFDGNSGDNSDMSADVYNNNFEDKKDDSDEKETKDDDPKDFVSRSSSCSKYNAGLNAERILSSGRESGQYSVMQANPINEANVIRTITAVWREKRSFEGRCRGS